MGEPGAYACYLRCRPKFPFGDEWFDPEHLQKLCDEAGFSDVQVSQKDSIWRGPSLEKFTQSMTEVFGPMLTGQGWSDEEVGKMTGEIKRAYQENKHWLTYDEKDGSVASKSVGDARSGSSSTLLQSSD